MDKPCDTCGADGLYVEDPYIREIHPEDAPVFRWLCEFCYSQRWEEI